MTERLSQGEQFDPGRVPDELIDAVLDGSADIEHSRTLFKQLSQSPDAAREVASTQRAIEALRSPVRTPDLSGRVLGELARRHGFTTPAMRRQVWMRRVAAAAALVVVVGGAFAVQRFVPEAATLLPQATPVSDVVAAVPEPTTQIAGFKARITCGLDDLPTLSTLARTCTGAQQACDEVVVACDADSRASDGDEPAFTMVVLQRTAPRRPVAQPVAMGQGMTPTTEQFLALPHGKADLAWAHAKSMRPTTGQDTYAQDTYAMWGPASGASRVEPMMLVSPTATFDWIGLSGELAQPTNARGGATPYR
ncbi:MAG: hypothetical protein KDA20_10625 [Phycisphaerales bacterium]|nr:hypothetical protein [Phycisphaerales bacterium]